MNYLEPNVAFDFLKELPEDKRYDVIRRIATTEEMPTDLVRQIDEILKVRAFTLMGQQTDAAGENRFKTVAQMLNIADPSISKSIIDRMTKELPDEADNIQALMFVFEDLNKVPDKDMQKVLGEVDKADLALALKELLPKPSKSKMPGQPVEACARFHRRRNGNAWPQTTQKWKRHKNVSGSRSRIGRKKAILSFNVRPAEEMV